MTHEHTTPPVNGKIDPIRPEIRAHWEAVAEREGNCILYGMAYHLHNLESALHNIETHLKTIQNGQTNNYGN